LTTTLSALAAAGIARRVVGVDGGAPKETLTDRS
jgi:hypothetical protein